MCIENCCAFTGHRKIEDNFDYSSFIEFITSFLSDGVNTFYCGMAMGFDLIAAEAVLQVKKDRPDVKLIACVPCKNQDKYYPQADKLRYAAIIESCDEVIVLHDHYYNGCMLLRDRFMVDNCGSVIAYYRNNDGGGTAYTVSYARSKNRKLFIV